jgi:hypothetical protein
MLYLKCFLGHLPMFISKHSAFTETSTLYEFIKLGKNNCIFVNGDAVLKPSIV